jgi:hypothetical protein
MVAVPGNSLLQRWRLDHPERECVVRLPTENPLRQLLMGSNSAGPLVLWSDGPVMLYDVEAMAPVKRSGEVLSGSPHYGFRLRIAADGRTLVGWHGGISGQRYAVMHLEGDRTTIGKSPDGFSHAGHWAQPTADGRLLLRSGGQFYTGDLRRVAAGSFDGCHLLPCADPRFFLAIRHDGQRTILDVCSTQDRRSVVRIDDLGAFMNTDLPRQWGAQRRQPRLRLVPSAGVLILLPPDDQHIVVRRLDLEAAAVAGGACHVVSLPPLAAVRGQEYRYDLEVWSGDGRPRFALETAPEGMAVSRQGRLTWEVPAERAGDRVPVIVSVRDRKGNEALHSFDVNISSTTRSNASAR